MAARDRNGSLGSESVLGAYHETVGHFEDEIGLDLEDEEQNIELASSAPPDDQ